MRSPASFISRRQLFLLAGAAARLAASEPPFWNTKPANEWDLGDIYRLSNKSPWANPVQAFAPARDQGWPPAGRWGGTTPLGDWGPKGVVTWESARPIREALKTPLPRMFNNCYVIGVDGISTGGGGYPDYQRSATFLRGKGKVKWSLRAIVSRELIRNSAVRLFGFPRTFPIDVDMSEVYFEAQFGRWQVQTKFHPRDMIYKGELAI